MFRLPRCVANMRLFLCFVFVWGTFSSGNGLEDKVKNKGNVIGPYDQILQLFNVSTTVIGVNTLQTVLDTFSAKFSCGESQENNGSDSTCPLPFCLNASQLLNTIGIVDEETFENFSIILLSIVTDLNETCHSHIDITPETVHYYRNKLTSLLDSYGSSQNWTVGAFQELIEVLSLTEAGDDHDDDADDDHAAAADDGGDDHDDDAEDDHNDEDGDNHEQAEGGLADNHVETFSDKCVEADVLYDQLGWTITEVASADNTGHLFSLLVYHILKGSRVSRDCRTLPRHEFFPLTIFREHGDNNVTLDQDALKEIMEELGIGSPRITGSDAIVDDHGHSHRRKRAIAATDFLFQKSWDSQCFTSGQLLAIYDVDGDVTIQQFSNLCPALIQQQLSKACVTEITEEGLSDDGKTSTAARYGYGSIATLLVCLASAIGAVFVRYLTKEATDRLVHLFVGLAVGTLLSDALIHLIPQAMGLHGHEKEEGDVHEGEGIVVKPFVWYAMVVVGGVYLFYLLELFMASVTCCKHTHSHDDGDHIDGVPPGTMEVKVTKSSGKYLPEEREFSIASETPSNSLTCGLAPVVYMILIGDGIHNFLDGMAIGASFSISVTIGVSTSIAVLCHEIPHELGDFAILLKSGMPFCRALIVNFLSSLTAMMGFYIGVAISTNEDAERWIIAATSGMFIYISLVIMLPGMLKQAHVSMTNVLLNNVGILLGFATMVLLAVFEEKITIQ